MTQAIVDPQLAAFYASDPSVLLDPSVPQVEVPRRRLTDQERAAIEIASAFLVVVALTRKLLAEQPPPVNAQVVAGQAWQHHAPLWLRLAVPAIKTAYVDAGVGDAELEMMATEYAGTLGSYLSDSSADSLAAGFHLQVVGTGNRQAAWARSTSAYGLDEENTRGIIATLSAGADKVASATVTAAARIAIDKALMVRADLLGQTEAWTASQTGKRIAWISRQRRGEISVGARVRWNTRSHERDCPICGPMDGVEVPLDQPFEMPDQTVLWAPTAHPHCACEVELLEVDGFSKALAKDPYDRDRKGRFADREYRTRDVTHLVMDPEVQRIVAEAQAHVANPFGVDTRPAVEHNPFGAPVHANPFGQAAVNPFGVTRNPFGEPNPFAGLVAIDNPFVTDQAAETEAPAGRTVRRNRRVVFMAPIHRAASAPPPPPKTAQHYLNFFDVSEYFDYNYDGVIPADVDFDEINDHFANEYREYGNDAQQTNYRPVASLGDTPWGHAYDTIEDFTADEWSNIVAQAMPLWHSAREDAAELLAEQGPRPLSNSEVRDIHRMAGYGDQGDPRLMRTEILANIQGADDRDQSLADAFADYMTWSSADKLGPAGKAFDQHLAALTGGETYLSSEPQVVFSFNQGFNGDTPELHGTYSVTNAAYHSALADFGLGAPNGRISLIDYELQPSGVPTAQPMADFDPDEVIEDEVHPFDR